MCFAKQFVRQRFGANAGAVVLVQTSRSSLAFAPKLVQQSFIADAGALLDVCTSTTARDISILTY